MADAGGSRLNIGFPVEKQGRGRPCGSKNKPTVPAVVASSCAPAKRRPGRPTGSKNKPKVSSAAPGEDDMKWLKLWRSNYSCVINRTYLSYVNQMLVQETKTQTRWRETKKYIVQKRNRSRWHCCCFPSCPRACRRLGSSRRCSWWRRGQ
jgi:hypothetical protein